MIYSHMATFRFNILNSTLNEEMIIFAKFHKYTNTTLLKESYVTWCKNDAISLLIHEEEKRLFNKNYNFHQNNIYTKIFKSIKYYHMKKLRTTNLGLEQVNVAQERRGQIDHDTSGCYCRFRSVFLQLVKTHIVQDLSMKPSLSYDLFCSIYRQEIDEEMKHIRLDTQGFMLKMKKMYKNQFYQLSKQPN